jgi:glycosyltransferase involved in cell wall biosynthesis
MIGVVIPTYYRHDGASAQFLTRALESVRNQTYKEYEIYLIGDDYLNISEFNRIADKYEAKAVNLPYAVERERYSRGSYQLWCSGGVNATNYGIAWALMEGIKYICHLDHDDYWAKEHLEIINEYLPKYFMVYTRSTYMGGVLPGSDRSGQIQPEACGLIHSATCIDFSATKLRLRDCYPEKGKAYPADADLWIRIKREQRKTYYDSRLTVFHDQEGV